MGFIGLFLYFLTSLIIEKDNLPLKSEIKATNKKLVASFKYWNIKLIIRNNFNIKPIILKLFFISWIIDFILLGVIVTTNFFYLGVSSIWKVIGYHKDGFSTNGMNLSWIGIVIINTLFLIVVIRFISDSLKLSYRGIYQRNYSKMLLLDLLTLNILSIIGILIYLKNKTPIIEDYKSNDKLDFRNTRIKLFFKLLVKIEIITFLIFLIVFVLALVVGHFVVIPSLKLISLIASLFSLVLIYAWSIIRIVGIFIINIIIKKFLQNNSYYCFLTLIRIVGFIYGYYYLAVLINLFDLNEKEK